MKTMARATKNYGVFCHKNGYVKRFYCLLSCVIKKIINFHSETLIFLAVQVLIFEKNKNQFAKVRVQNVLS